MPFESWVEHGDADLDDRSNGDDAELIGNVAGTVVDSRIGATDDECGICVYWPLEKDQRQTKVKNLYKPGLINPATANLRCDSIWTLHGKDKEVFAGKVREGVICFHYF